MANIFAPDPSTSQSTPLYGPGVAELSSFLSNDILRRFLFPYQRQGIQDWSNIGRGAFDLAPGVVEPARSAGLQGMAQFGGLTSDLPGNIAAPLQESVAMQARQLPRVLQTIAPDQLAALVKSLIDPQFQGLLSPATSTTSVKGGASTVASGLGIGSTLGTLAQLGSQVASWFV